ncbi:MAG: hypothetical protein JW963_15495 [Anaerolineales bacterium]|nr:hypothetical protein [Anaerolineales bacterium]
MLKITLSDNNKPPFLRIGILCLVSAIALTWLDIHLGMQVNYLDHLLFFNVLTVSVLVCASIAIVLSIAGLWRTHFKSLPLVFINLAASAFLILLFLID